MPPPDDDLTAEVDAWIGKVLSDRYRLDALLGEGAMGRVYSAQHVMMRKRVAVKILHPELTRVPEVVSRFEREAMAAANIDHPNVAAATDFGKLEDGSIYLVLEFVEGRSLRDELLNGSMSIGRSLHIIRQMGAALAAAHSLDIVHRDLKPENVMLVRKAHDPDFVKVLDFGIAKVPVDVSAAPGSQAGSPITRVGMVFGTPEYMAPEQALGKEVDCRADMYAMGVILYELLTGLRPFDDKNELGVLGQQLSKPVPRMSDRVPGTEVPEGVEMLAHRLLKRDAGERPGSANEVVRSADGLLAQYAPELLTVVPGSLPGTGSYPGTHTIPGFGSYPSSSQVRAAMGSEGTLYPDSTPQSGEAGAPSTLSSHDLGHNAGDSLHDLRSQALGGSSADLRFSAFDPAFPAAAPGKAGGAADLLQKVRDGLPPKLQQLPTGVLIGAPLGLIGVTTLFVILLVGAVATNVPAAPASAQPSAEVQPTVEPSTEASAQELETAKKDGVEAVEALSKLYPEDTRVMLELGRSYALNKRRVEAVDTIAKAIKLDPNAAKDPSVASTLWVAAQDEASQDKAFELMQGPMGAKGADIIYDLVMTDGVRHQVVARAAKWLTTKEFQKNSSPALNVAVALRHSKTCRQRAGLLPRAKNVGDKRSLLYLHRFATRAGCGKRGTTDCNPCLRSDESLKETIEAIEKRGS